MEGDRWQIWVIERNHGFARVVYKVILKAVYSSAIKQQGPPSWSVTPARLFLVAWLFTSRVKTRSLRLAVGASAMAHPGFRLVLASSMPTSFPPSREYF